MFLRKTVDVSVGGRTWRNAANHREREGSKATLSCRCCSPSDNIQHQRQLRVDCVTRRKVEVVIREELRRHAHVDVHQGKTQVWNRGGLAPDGIEELTRVAKLVKPDAVVWKGDSSLPRECQGIRVLGAPIGTPEYVADQLAHKSREQEVCWLLLLMCASTRANFWLRMIRPDQTLQYAERHDAAVWGCLCAILGSPGVPADAQVTASFPLSMGGLGLTSAVRSRVAAHWSSWADCIKMVRDRHPIVADLIMHGIDHHPALCFDAVRTCEHLWWKLDWRSHLGERCQSLRQLARHIQNRMARSLVGNTARTCLWKNRFASHWTELSQPVKALWRSQRGPLASVALTALPTSRATRIEPQPFRIWLSPSSPAPSSHLPQLPMWPPT